MQSILKKLNEYKIMILAIMISPIAMYMFNVLVKVLFNTGTYLGTFLRYIYYYVVCYN